MPLIFFSYEVFVFILSCLHFYITFFSHFFFLSSLIQSVTFHYLFLFILHFHVLFIVILFLPFILPHFVTFFLLFYSLTRKDKHVTSPSLLPFVLLSFLLIVPYFSFLSLIYSAISLYLVFHLYSLTRKKYHLIYFVPLLFVVFFFFRSPSLPIVYIIILSHFL